MIYGIVADGHDPQPYRHGGYVAQGVLLDNSDSSTALTAASQTAADSHFVTASLWLMVSAHINVLTLNPSSQSLIDMNLNGAASLGAVLSNGTGLSSVEFDSDASAVSFNAWHHLFVSADLNHAAGSKLLNLYLDGVSIRDPSAGGDTDPAFLMNVNGVAFGLPAAASQLSALNANISFSDVWIGVGQYVDPSAIASFRSSAGRPVFLGANGELPTGTSPTYFFSGDATAFATNKGTGDAVSLTGTLAAAPSNP